jgi:hypothetical protein
MYSVGCLCKYDEIFYRFLPRQIASWQSVSGYVDVIDHRREGSNVSARDCQEIECCDGSSRSRLDLLGMADSVDKDRQALRASLQLLVQEGSGREGGGAAK